MIFGIKAAHIRVHMLFGGIGRVGMALRKIRRRYPCSVFTRSLINITKDRPIGNVWINKMGDICLDTKLMFIQ